ncbi:phosphatidylglycerol lysyltransferase domain-containing protein [Lysinibacter sp. HNR]|uniref:phosphatidylglycerol lysyltransferase domain-containing protein n=1 Tax=Lysinibacter sp. HNR TaxID=3031408 RepID=UPI0024352291|nr:phosphatidylglycerol lysyltransferase domain-containing protein [Lysinibacter sp. HNR]WGD37136.1 phosphatidylglycerol lysyltransferase domain-containing protein [Lysinibacter sp. HNR]
MNYFSTRYVTLIIALIVLSLGVIGIFLRIPHETLGHLGSTGYGPIILENRWWSPFTALFVTANYARLIAGIFLVIFLVGAVEPVLGSWRTLLAWVTTPTVGIIVGVLLQEFGMQHNGYWAHSVQGYVSATIFGAVTGVLTTASAFYGPLWRRRIRLFTLMSALMFVLYSGRPADVYLLLAGCAGLGLGILLRRKRPQVGWQRSSHNEARVLMASTVTITAIGPIIALLSTSRWGLLAPLGLLLSPGGAASHAKIIECQAHALTNQCFHEIALSKITQAGPLSITLIPLVIMLISAYGILRGRRFALWLAIGVNILFSMLALFYFGLAPLLGFANYIRERHHYWQLSLSITLSIVIPLAIAITLFLLRRHCTIPPRPGSIRRALIAVLATALSLSAIYLLIGVLMPHSFDPEVSLGELLADLPKRFVPVSFLAESSSFTPSGHITGFIYHAVGPLLWIIILVALIAPLASSRPTQNEEDESRARDMFKRGGGSSLSYMALWPGNTWWFDQESDTVIGYRVVNGVAITTGGPFGPGSGSYEPLYRFARFCDDNGWLPVFYSIEERYAPAFSTMGWVTMTVAEETVLRPQQWNTTGKKWQDVRTAVNRAKRTGIRSEWVSYTSLPHNLRTQITHISDQWIAEKELPEMGFTLGGVKELVDPEVMLMLAIDSEGQIQGITSWLPQYDSGQVVGWTLDFMRRAPEGPNGIMEFLIAEAAEHMRDSGIRLMSLSAAPLTRETAEPSAASNTDRLLAYLSDSLEPVYGFKSLFAFKKKFQPEFHPLLMAYPDSTSLPAVGWALTRAYLPGVSTRQLAKMVRGATASSGDKH